MNKNIRLAIIVVFLWTLAAVAFGQANQWGPFDPGAARSTLSNVTPATGRDALELGTMAVATATDYVATDTFAGHTDATGASVHGLGTISTKADTDYVATSSLAARLDTINASFTGNIGVTGDVGAATVNGVAPLTAAEKTQALVGSTTVDFLAKDIDVYGQAEVISDGAAGRLISTAHYVSVADDASGTIALAGRIAGTIYIVEGNSDFCAQFYFSNTTTVEEHDINNKFSVTPDTDNSVNVTIIGTNIIIGNRIGALSRFRVAVIGMTSSI